MKAILLTLLVTMTLWADAHLFVYHRFGDSRHPSTNTTINELKSQFEYFKSHNYKIIPLKKLTDALMKKELIPDDWVVLTIDDNFKSFYANALKIFKEYNYPFSLFVYVEATQKKYPDYLSWDELREIKKYGSLEFHSYGHKHMTKLSDDEIREDFKKGLYLFKKELNIKPKVFTYPYGEYSQRVQKIVKSYNFDAIINQNMGAVGSFSDIYDIDRIALVGSSNLKLYLRYKALDAKWEKPLEFPKNAILENLIVKTEQKAKYAEIYVSGHGWSKVKLKSGNFNEKLNKKLKKRSRVIVKIGNKVSSKLLIKDRYGAK